MESHSRTEQYLPDIKYVEKNAKILLGQGVRSGVRFLDLAVFLHLLCIFDIWKVFSSVTLRFHSKLSENLTRWVQGLRKNGTYFSTV